MSEAASNKALLLALGLASRARKLICGTDIICTQLRAKASEVKLVIEASDTSDNTHKKINDKCAYYGIRCVRVSVDALDLGHAVGKGRQVASLAITDEALATLVLSKLEDATWTTNI